MSTILLLIGFLRLFINVSGYTLSSAFPDGSAISSGTCGGSIIAEWDDTSGSETNSIKLSTTDTKAFYVLIESCGTNFDVRLRLENKYGTGVFGESYALANDFCETFIVFRLAKGDPRFLKVLNLDLSNKGIFLVGPNHDQHPKYTLYITCGATMLSIYPNTPEPTAPKTPKPTTPKPTTKEPTVEAPIVPAGPIEPTDKPTRKPTPAVITTGLTCDYTTKLEPGITRSLTMAASEDEGLTPGAYKTLCIYKQKGFNCNKVELTIKVSQIDYSGSTEYFTAKINGNEIKRCGDGVNPWDCMYMGTSIDPWCDSNKLKGEDCKDNHRFGCPSEKDITSLLVKSNDPDTFDKLILSSSNKVRGHSACDADEEGILFKASVIIKSTECGSSAHGELEHENLFDSETGLSGMDFQVNLSFNEIMLLIFGILAFNFICFMFAFMFYKRCSNSAPKKGYSKVIYQSSSSADEVTSLN